VRLLSVECVIDATYWGWGKDYTTNEKPSGWRVWESGGAFGPLNVRGGAYIYPVKHDPVSLPA